MTQQQEWQGLAIALDKHGLSWRKISELLDKPKSTVSDYLRGYREWLADEEMIEAVVGNFDDWKAAEAAEKHDNSRVLFISDMHLPYHHPGLLPFLEGLKLRYGPTRVVCLGDELDKHAMSFHDSDPDLPSAGDELKKSLPTIKEIEKLFPKMDLIDSNHGSLLYRKAKHHGIPRHYLKGYNEVLEVGEGWKWHFDLTLDLPDGQKVYVHHGKNSSALKVAQLTGMSHVCGHYHESFGIQYASTPAALLFGINAGCLIDRKALAFAYSNNNMKRAVIGTALIIDGVPILEAMPL